MTRHEMTGNEMSGDAAGGMEKHEYDVVVIGAGGSGLRAAIAARRPAPPAPTTTTSYWWRSRPAGALPDISLPVISCRVT